MQLKSSNGIVYLYALFLVIWQDEVIAELKEYSEGDPAPQDAASVKKTILYLSALNNLLEHSLLGQKVRVFNAEGLTI